MHEKYLELAEEEFNAARYLFDGGYLRGAASRAYFSMFHGTKALLYLKDNYPKTYAGVISQFGKEFVKSGEIDKTFGEMLARAETLRSKADYDVEREITKEEVEDILDACKKFLGKIDEVIRELEK